MLDIIQANLIQIAIFIFHYHKQLSVLPMFLNFFLTKVKYMVIQLKQPVAIDQTIAA